MDPAELEDALDRELKALPQLHAPQRLLPRIMAAAAAHRAAPRATGWLTWPVAWQAASALGVAALAAGLWMLITAPPQPVSDAARTANEAATVMRAFWEVLLQPVATYVLALGVGLTLAVALAWAGLELALGGASQR